MPEDRASVPAETFAGEEAAADVAEEGADAAEDDFPEAPDLLLFFTSGGLFGSLAAASAAFWAAASAAFLRNVVTGSISMLLRLSAASATTTESMSHFLIVRYIRVSAPKYTVSTLLFSSVRAITAGFLVIVTFERLSI